MEMMEFDGLLGECLAASHETVDPVRGEQIHDKLMDLVNDEADGTVTIPTMVLALLQTISYVICDMVDHEAAYDPAQTMQVMHAAAAKALLNGGQQIGATVEKLEGETTH